MADICIFNTETEQMGITSFSEDAFKDVLNCTRLIGNVKMKLLNVETGMTEYHIVWKEYMKIIH